MRARSAYCDRVVASALQHPSGPATLGPALLPRLLHACAQCGHRLPRASLDALAGAAVALLPAMGVPGGHVAYLAHQPRAQLLPACLRAARTQNQSHVTAWCSGGVV